MKSSERIDQLVDALAKAQLEFPPLVRNKEVFVVSRSGTRFAFKYATLDRLLDAVRAPLANHGLVLVQTTHQNGQQIILETTLLHNSGQWISSELVLRPGETSQEFGSSLTYMRRYAIAALLCLAPEEDDDANIADGHEINGVRDLPIKPAGTSPRIWAEPFGETSEPEAGEAALRKKLPPAIWKKLEALGVSLDELREYVVWRWKERLEVLPAARVIVLQKVLENMTQKEDWQAEKAKWRKGE